MMISLSWAMARGAVAAGELPIPADAQSLPSIRMAVGQTTHHQEVFQTAWSVDAVRAFYQQQLETLGWTEQPLPQAATAFVSGMEQLLYASRGPERLLVEAMGTQDTTRVMLDQWEERSDETQMSGAVSSVPGQSSPIVPERNICCSSEAVSDQESRLPSDFPVYPDARRMVSAAPETGRVVSELFMSAASAEDVLAYYRRALETQGWRAVALPHLVADAAGAGAEGSLAYERPTGLCAIGVSADGRAAHDGSNESTIIMVSHIRREASTKRLGP